MIYTFESQLDAGAFLFWLGGQRIRTTINIGPPVSFRVGLAHRGKCETWLAGQRIAYTAKERAG